MYMQLVFLRYARFVMLNLTISLKSIKLIKQSIESSTLIYDQLRCLFSATHTHTRSLHKPLVDVKYIAAKHAVT